MEKINAKTRYSMQVASLLTARLPQHINYYIRTWFIKKSEYKISAPGRWHKTVILWEALLRILMFYPSKEK